jgi:hypothetical protein
MLRKILIGMFVFCAAFAVFAESEVKLSADGKEVVCGNKKLLLKQDGSIIVANAAGSIAKITLNNAFINKKTGATEWGFHSPSLCKMSVEEGKVKWYIAKWRGNESFKVAEQTLEVMPDGLVKLSTEFENIDNDEIKFRNRGALFVLLPVSGNEGRQVIYNDKTLTISEKITSQDWRSEEYKYTIFSDVPDAAFTISAKKPEVKDTTLYRVGKEIRFTYVFPAEGPQVTYIDLRAKHN